MDQLSGSRKRRKGDRALQSFQVLVLFAEERRSYPLDIPDLHGCRGLWASDLHTE